MHGLTAGYRRTDSLSLLRDVGAGLPNLVRELLRTAGGGELGTSVAPRSLAVSVVGEQVPNATSRITLTADRDMFGMPKVRLDWRPTDLDLRGWTRALVRLASAVAAAGVGRIALPSEAAIEAAIARLRPGCHHIGTTRMSVDAGTGVVDPNAHVRGVANLYVAGSSVFPTAGYANPMLTSIALALRLADHLKRVR